MLLKRRGACEASMLRYVILVKSATGRALCVLRETLFSTHRPEISLYFGTHRMMRI
jgi:hypothetical protein